MATLRIDTAHDIGSAAGKVWHFLNENGPASLAKITKDLDEPRDVVLQGIGWLAREGKVSYIDGKGKTKLVGLS
jgi:hypothetical protein